MRITNVLGGVILAASLPYAGTGSASTFDIILDISGATSAQAEAFTIAASIWETLITGYTVDDYSTPLTVSMSVTDIDGSGGTLGYGGPSYGQFADSELYVTSGLVAFDTDDIDSYSLTDLVTLALHEVAHVIGFGTLWEYGPYDLTDASGYRDAANATEYTGANAVAAYNDEMGLTGDSLVTSIALEEAGGSGTAGSHWDETDYGLGTDDITYELMTGWYNGADSAYISAFTLASFEDLGYTTLWSEGSYTAMSIDELIAMVTAVPLPGSLMLIGSGFGLLTLIRKGRRA
ncbi:Zinc metalloendopeptidase, leishmanolysin family [Rhodovulum sp. P5]|uniref:leishmanolysin-related zinc metalloendopeptidase n=1 Tax=Rhodovulum sp. P5 TaxID=1564506 RepID=UPI0009C1E251|nr:leishmanolysin-related zinc metalloendopeptidase [Rhodovulum sp. P5]ARE40998.1 Zinc metalloendopeptidase, leishmanolysin family [Rhodovulum sp. P5]